MSGVWTSSSPIVICGYTLTPDEAWKREFAREWIRLAGGDADAVQLSKLARSLLASKSHQNPVEVAQAEWAGRS